MVLASSTLDIGGVRTGRTPTTMYVSHVRIPVHKAETLSPRSHHRHTTKDAHAVHTAGCLLAHENTLWKGANEPVRPCLAVSTHHQVVIVTLNKYSFNLGWKVKRKPSTRQEARGVDTIVCPAHHAHEVQQLLIHSVIRRPCCSNAIWRYE